MVEARLAKTKRPNDVKFIEFHGMRYTGEHSVWHGMIARCERPGNISYPRYGGRGVRVCERWRMSFVAFYNDMGPRPSPSHTIDRKDANGNYEPSNCRWATKSEQRRNSSQKMRYFTIDGETLCLQDWCLRRGLRENLVRYRLSRGWPYEKAFSTARHNRAGVAVR